jgi:protease II
VPCRWPVRIDAPHRNTSINAFELVDFAFNLDFNQHIRGGSEIGRHWYYAGRQLKKKNSFTDFIDVSKLRDNKTDDNLLLLKTDMEAGYGGKTGRFKRLEDAALHYTFYLYLEGISE